MSPYFIFYVISVFVALSTCIAVQLGERPGWMFFQCITATTLFYCAHWQTYVSGKFMHYVECYLFIFKKYFTFIGTLRFGKVDVTEAQCSIMCIHLISAIFGSQIWSTKVNNPIL
jgi:hypothetical protein